MATTDQRIKWMNSINNATLVVTKLIEKSTTDINVKDELTDLANWFYLLEPINSDIEEKIRLCNTKEQLALLKDEIALTKDKSIYASFNDKIIELDAREKLAK